MKKHNAFLDTFEYLEKYDDETITMDELHHIMKLKTGLGDDDVYTKLQLKRLLIDHYRDEVSITSIRQQANIVTLTSNVKNIIKYTSIRLCQISGSSPP